MNAPTTFPDTPEQQAGIALSCRAVSRRERKVMPWLPETLWSAIHPNGSNYGMGVGGTADEARAMLVRNFPELGSEAA